MKPTESQRICIEETFGMPSAVVAGAGSGKTATLTNRIVHVLAHPDQSGRTTSARSWPSPSPARPPPS